MSSMQQNDLEGQRALVTARASYVTGAPAAAGGGRTAI